MNKLKVALYSILTACAVLVISEKNSFATTAAGSEVSGAAVAPDSSVFPALSSATLDANYMFVSSAGVIVYGLHLSSITAGSHYVALFSTSIAGNGVLSHLNGVSTRTVAGFSATSDRQIQFNPPLRFPLGLVTKATGCLNSVNGFCYAVIFDIIGNRKP